MKKILLVLLALTILFSLCACGTENEPAPTPTATPVPIPTPYNSSASIIYETFEELIETATDVVKGKIIKKEVIGNSVEYEVEVLERYKGEAVKENIFIKTQNNNGDKRFKENEEYYFIVERRRSVYFEHDTYIYSGADLYFPAENIKESTAYHEPLIEHSDIPDNFDEEIFVEYIKKVINARNGEDKLFYGADYTESTDLKTIIAEADCVIEVEPFSEYETISTGTDIYFCEVISVLKGNVLDKKEIEVIFPKDTVKKGEKYLLALDESETGRYLFSSKNSMLDVARLDEISEYIK